MFGGFASNMEWHKMSAAIFALPPPAFTTWSDMIAALWGTLALTRM
jgi:hypothetical protein